MKKKFLYSVLIFSVFLLTACNSNGKNVDKISDRVFSGDKGGTILVSIDKNNGNKMLVFSGTTVIKPNTDPSKLSEKSVKKEKTQEFKNPKIIKKSGEEYLTADDFEYSLKIIDDNTIQDTEDNNVYRSMPVNK